MAEGVGSGASDAADSIRLLTNVYLKNTLIQSIAFAEETMDLKRIIAGLIDFFISSTLQAVFMMLFLIRPFFFLESKGEMYNVVILALIATFCALVYMLVRDIIGEKSIGKLIMKLKIINKNNEAEAVFSKRLLRNLTWLLGPCEFLVFLITKERLGDKIAGTKVIGLI